MDNTLEQRVVGVVASVLQIDTDQVDLDTGIGSTPNWDSLGHLSIVSGIQDEFGIEMSVDDVIDCECVEDFVEVVKRSL